MIKIINIYFQIIIIFEFNIFNFNIYYTIQNNIQR